MIQSCPRFWLLPYLTPVTNSCSAPQASPSLSCWQALAVAGPRAWNGLSWVDTGLTPSLNQVSIPLNLTGSLPSSPITTLWPHFPSLNYNYHLTLSGCSLCILFLCHFPLQQKLNKNQQLVCEAPCMKNGAWPETDTQWILHEWVNQSINQKVSC